MRLPIQTVGKEYTKMFMCCNLLNGYIIKIKSRVIDPVCSARCEDCFGFTGIKSKKISNEDKQ